MQHLRRKYKGNDLPLMMLSLKEEPQSAQHPKPQRKPQADMNALRQAFMKNRT